MAYVAGELLGRLVGRSLYQVSFVHDYVQLWFDGDPDSKRDVFLNCEARPRVIVGQKEHQHGDPAWASALVDLIGSEVAGVREATGIGIELEVGDAVLSLHPTVDELEGPEIALLDGFEDGAWMVWRPGEDSFEDLV